MIGGGEIVAEGRQVESRSVLRLAVEKDKPYPNLPIYSSPRDEAPARTQTPKRVLVVEDNLDSARTLTLLLREMGHKVDYAINGYAGLEAARRFKPELIFLDLGLPGMDGFELCRLLRKEPELKDVRIIAITGYAQDDYRQRSLKSGCDMHFVKPLDPKVIAHLLG